MLIDRSYFIGHLNIPYNGSDDVATIEKINTFIEWHEAEFLTKLLGSDLYNAFSAGLLGQDFFESFSDGSEEPQGADYEIEEKWTDLLAKIVEGVGTITSANLISNTVVVVGDGGAYDPVQGMTEVVLPPNYEGRAITVNQRGYGELELGYDYLISGGVLTLLRSTFSNGDRYYYSSGGVSLTTTSGGLKKSMIANYVYFHWMQDQATQTGGVGEVLTKTENAARTSPEDKMVFAWNEMVVKANALQRWLSVYNTTYPDWEGTHNYYWQACGKPEGMAEKFYKINVFGI